MNWFRYFLVVAGAGVITSMTDWLFAGDWIHKRFTYPEVWRKGSETKATLVASLLPFLTAAAFAYLAHRMDIETLRNSVKLAAAIWVIGPLPLILTDAAFIKLHRVFVMSYAIGWLVKLMIIAVLVGHFLR
jgi:hypothetical protein